MAKRQKQKGEGLMDLAKLTEALEKQASPVRAAKMKSYMRDQFEFLGISTVLRKKLSEPFAAEFRELGAIDWDFISDCWLCPWREVQYFAIERLYDLRRLLTPQDMPKLKRLMQVKPWWDTIDSLDSIVSYVATKYPELDSVILEWSKDKSLWVRRVAICHQLDRRRKTKKELFAKILDNNLDSNEYFINKAISWSLREYGRYNPNWVRDYIETRRDRLSPAAVNESSMNM
jgi:3-methyladenine DNA glycosylase AlkD